MITVGDLVDEFRDCDFGDARLAKRVMEMASVLGNNPNLSITTAFKTKAEFEACYRFFDNEKVSPEKHLNHTSVQLVNELGNVTMSCLFKIQLKLT